MNKPSSTITATMISGFIAATFLLSLKLWAPEVHAQIPSEYQTHLVVGIACVIGYFKKENVLK